MGWAEGEAELSGNLNRSLSQSPIVALERKGPQRAGLSYSLNTGGPGEEGMNQGRWLF